MQKLVTIFINHDKTQEHLQEELKDGWRIVRVTGIGLAFDEDLEDNTGYFAVVLEKDE